MDELLDFLSSTLVERDSYDKMNYIVDMMIKADYEDLKALSCMVAKKETTMDDVLSFIENEIEKRYPSVGEEYMLLKDIRTNSDIIPKGDIHTIEYVEKGIVYLSSKNSVGGISVGTFRDYFKLKKEEEDLKIKLVIEKEYKMLDLKFKIIRDNYINDFICIYNDKDVKMYFAVENRNDKEILDLVYEEVLKHMGIK